MINRITILVYYLFLFIVSKIDKYKFYINEKRYESYFIDTQDCVREYLILEDFDYYRDCVSTSLFRNLNTLNEFPENQNKYLQKFIDELGNEDNPTFEKNFKPIYFEFMLEMLEISATDENYNSIYTDITDSTNVDKNKIYSDIKSGKIDMKQITDDRYNKVAEKLYYKNLFNDISKTYEGNNFNAKDFFKSDDKNEDIFLEVLNEELLSNSGTNDDLRYYINYHNSYNIKSRELDRGEINKRGIENAGFFNKTEIDKLNRFLVDYKSTNIKTIIERMDKNEKSEYNIFDMIFNLSTFLNNDLKIMYLYEKDDNNKLNITSKIDPDSIYEGSESFSESIYNLIYDYYSVIYNIYENEEKYDEQDLIYYYDNDKIVYDLIDVAALNALMESDFYQSIYSTMVFVEKQNGVKNKYISKTIELVNELFNFYTSNQELRKIEKIKKEETKEKTKVETKEETKDKTKEETKEEIGDQNEINYEKDINDSYDVLFKENTFIDLIDYESDYSVYFSQLQKYIQNSCKKYNSKKFYSKGISAIELENYYNSRVVDSEYVLNAASETCLDDDETMYSDWNKQVSKSVDESIKSVETMRNAQLFAVDTFVKYLIYDDIESIVDDQNETDTLTKRDDSRHGKKYELQFNDPNNKKSRIILLKNKITSNLKNIYKRQRTEKSPFNIAKEILETKIGRDYGRMKSQLKEELDKNLASMAPGGEAFVKGYEIAMNAASTAIDSVSESIGKVAGLFGFNPDREKEKLKTKLQKFITQTSELRDLNIIGGKEIGDRTVQDFKRFHLEHCRNDEIKFFSLARSYNRIMGEKEPYLKEKLNGFDGEIDIKVFSVPSSMKDKNDIKEEIEKTKNQYKNDMRKIFTSYLIMKNPKYIDSPKSTLIINEEITNFNIKLELASQREAFYSRDLSNVVEKLESYKSLDEMKIGYPIDELKKTIDNLMDEPYSIEQGYSDLVTHVDKKFFHNYNENNKQGEEKYDTSRTDNDYDKLTANQKIVISDVMYESPLNLYAIKYSDKIGYNVQPSYYEDIRYECLETANKIGNYYSDEFIIKRAPVKHMVRPKKFLRNNHEVEEPNDKQDVFYMDKDNKIKKADFSTQTYFKDMSSKAKQKKEYILPDEPGEAYIASKEEYKSSSTSLPSNQKFIVSDENGEFTFVETDNNGIITNGVDITNKKLYTCEKVDVEYAEMVVPEKIKTNDKIPKTQKSNVYSYKNGLVQSRADEGYMEYRFKGDNTKYEGYAISVDRDIKRENTGTLPNDSYSKSRKTTIYRNEFKTIYRKSKAFLKTVYEKTKKYIGKKAKGGNGKKPGKGN